MDFFSRLSADPQPYGVYGKGISMKLYKVMLLADERERADLLVKSKDLKSLDCNGHTDSIPVPGTKQFVSSSFFENRSIALSALEIA